MDADAFVAERRALRMPELEQSFIKAMKEGKWEDALRFARTAVELDPGCKRYVEFIPLLEEKLALANDEEEDDTAEEGEDNDEEEDTEDEEEEEDDEEEEKDDEEELADQDAEIELKPSQAAHPDLIQEENPSRLNKQQRSQLHATLESGIKNLKEKEFVEKLTALDPLLGA